MALSANSDLKVSAGEHEGDADTARSGPGTTLKTLGVLVLISIVLGGVWIGFGDRIMEMYYGSTGEVPVIAADPSPVKIRPENPGGMNVPNQGRLVYGVVDGSATQPRVERLLPSPEKPVEVEKVLTRQVPETTEVVSGTAPRGTADAADPNAPTRLVPNAGSSAAPAPPPLPTPEEVAKMDAPAPPPPPTASRVTESAAAPATTTPPTPPPAPAAQAPAPKPAPKPAPEPTQTARATPVPEAPTTDLDKSYRVQLAAARDEKAVESEWDRLRRRHVDLLGELSLQVTKVDFGGTKGVFYRLRAGPLANEQTAKTLCERLKQRKLGCLVVKPGS